MRVVIVGAGEVGSNAARMLSGEGHDVVLVEQDEALVGRMGQQLDAMVVRGNGATPRVLAEAGIEKSDLLVAATGSDEVNITSCLAAKHQGVSRTVARLHNPEYHESGAPFAQEVLGIDFVIHTEQVAVQEIKASLLIPGAVDVESFAGGRVEVAEVILDEDSPAVGRAVREVELPERSLVIGGVRDGEALMYRGDTVLEAGDHVFLISERWNTAGVVGAVATDTRPVREVMVYGGGRIGLGVAETLDEVDIAVKVIERDTARAQYVASRLRRGSVIQGKDISRELLLQEGVERVDAFIAVTGDDRANLLGAMYARQLGARLTIAGLGRGEFAPLAGTLGIDITISPRLLAAGAISRFVRRGDVAAVTLLESGAQMIELRVPRGCRIAGRPLSEVGVPKGAIVGMVLREGEVTVPTGKDALNPGDEVVIFAVEGTVDQVERLFSS